MWKISGITAKISKLVILIICIGLLVSVVNKPVYAYEFMHYWNWPRNTSWNVIEVWGQNITHSQPQIVLPFRTEFEYLGTSRYETRLFVELPEDGSQWILRVKYQELPYPNMEGVDPNPSYLYLQVSTPGTFTGYSPKTATDAANGAYNAANDARSYTWDSSESKSAATLAKEARDKANDALAAVNNIQTILSENFSAITSLKLQGLNGATVTRNNSFSIIATSKQGVTYTAICNGPSNPVISISDNIITLNNISVPGAYTVTVTAVSGSASLQESITFFKI